MLFAAILSVCSNYADGHNFHNILFASKEILGANTTSLSSITVYKQPCSKLIATK